MHRRTILLYLGAAVVALSIAQAVGISLYERREIEWLFTPSHFLGGASVALAVLYTAAGVSVRTTLLQCLSIVLVIGVAWEIWEYMTVPSLSAVDTVSDLFADVLGGYAAFALVNVKK